VALVEAALVIVLVFLVLFGILEFGLFFRDSLTASNVTREATRMGSAAGAQSVSSDNADYLILQSIKKAAAALKDPGAIEKIVIYNAGGPDAAGIPANCDPSSNVGYGGTPGADEIGTCNIFLPSDMDAPADDFTDGSTATGQRAGYWPAISRNDSKQRLRSDGRPGPDYVGVWVKIDHQWITGLFGDRTPITDSSMIRIEPRT
jgi:hypothetical protein